VGSWNGVTFIFSALQRSILVVKDDEIVRKNKRSVSQWFRSQSPEFCAKGIQFLKTCFRNFMYLQDDYMEN